MRGSVGRTPFVALLLLLLLPACGETHGDLTDGSTDPRDGGGTSTGDAGTTPPPPECPDVPAIEETRTVATTIPAVTPGAEQTVCRVLDLGNDAPAMIRAIRADLGAGSHHMIVYRTNAEPTDTHTPCQGIPGGEDTLLIAQRADTEVVYPGCAGLPIPANQRVRLEIHYMNYLADTTDIDAAVHFDLSPVDDALDPVRVMFTGITSFTIPEHTEGHEIESFHRVASDQRVFALTTHTHHRGVYASLHRATGLDDPNATLLHESYNWAEPPLDTFDPPLTFGADEGLRILCVYDNEDPHEVQFGMGFDQEMCFLWAYWY
jgi:hypothetical protein